MLQGAVTLASITNTRDNAGQLIVYSDGTIYATTIYPFTLLKVETVAARR